MRFYNGQHRHYCGVDLHTKRMYLCILDHEGNKLAASQRAGQAARLLERHRRLP